MHDKAGSTSVLLQARWSKAFIHMLMPQILHNAGGPLLELAILSWCKQSMAPHRNWNQIYRCILIISLNFTKSQASKDAMTAEED